MSQKQIRRPFVTPKLKEEASLAGVTLITQGGPTGNTHRHGGNYRGGNRRRHDSRGRRS